MNPLKVGYLVTFVGSWAESKSLAGKFYRILRKERLIYISNEGDKTDEFVAVATGAESGFRDIEALEPETNQLYQLRVGTRDGLKYHVKLTGKDRYGPALDIDMAYFTNQDSFWTDPSENYEFFLVKDMFPSYNAVNATGSTITPKLYFRGWQYDYEEAKEYTADKRPPEFTPITLGGLKS
ncbi:hypothetical protein ES703_108628 [subsurface metagenome]